MAVLREFSRSYVRLRAQGLYCTLQIHTEPESKIIRRGSLAREKEPPFLGFDVSRELLQGGESQKLGWTCVSEYRVHQDWIP